MNDLESAEKISIDIKKLERNLKQVEDINFEGKEKEKCKCLMRVSLGKGAKEVERNSSFVV